MILHADAVSCEWDEDGLHLYVLASTGDDVDVRFPDPDALLAAVRGAVDPWAAEREAARVSMPVRDDGEGYDLSDPKHPTYHERMSSLHDNRAGK